ncbi:hypothetical protein QC763_0069980 [Podospora pseudopauciseta]|uniref:Protein-S-isoprenylcysteine O-methyltransferase n=1 Tax=Podospora pseudopauciseta TaxID=2093780 RepID=A0ABR0HE31_9PEZI|nr:hypothetical protein QC763_0069980 [Podospora pseudopauciseta]
MLPPLPSLSQAALAFSFLASTIGTYFACRQPNPNPNPPTRSKSDSLTTCHITDKHATKIMLSPLGLLTLLSARLAYLYPALPPNQCRHLNPDLVTWSPSTAIPLALILCVGVPLRLASYASLGKNFTFALAEPDRLKTTGLYRYVQHPSYTGVVVLIFCNIALMARVDGVVSCWASERWYRWLRDLGWSLAPVGVSVVLGAVWTRVRQEEEMLRTKFGGEWEGWHSRTARCIKLVRSFALIRVN